MKPAIFLLGLLICFGCAHAHWKSLLCRIRHYKTLVSERNKVVGCKKNCPTDFVEKYSLRWGHHCRKISIPLGCADQYCVRCAGGYKWIYSYQYNQRCVKTCPEGYTDDAGTCNVCILRNCEECTSLWKCKQCDKGFALYTTLMDSKICLRECPKHYNNERVDGVATCVERENATMTSTTTSTTTTTMATTTTTPTTPSKPEIVLPKGCKDLNCRNCQTGFYKFYPLTKGNLCLEECPIGFAAMGDVCVACSDRRCASCKTSISECDKCFQGYSMLLDSANITLECVRTCPDGYVQNKVDNNVKICMKTKEPECPVTNCVRCVSESIQGFHKGCAQCSTGYSLFRGAFNDHCYNECPPGFFKSTKPGTNIGVCERCDAPFCGKCKDSKTCTDCVEPLVLDRASQKCTTCPPLKEYNFETKTCVLTNLNAPESNTVSLLDG